MQREKKLKSIERKSSRKKSIDVTRESILWLERENVPEVGKINEKGGNTRGLVSKIT